jgi:threonyl-tRNA synthetase
MSSVKVVLPDQSIKEFPHEPSVLEVAKSIGPKLAEQTVGAYLDDSKEIVDLRTRIKNGQKLKIVTTRDEAALEVIRHSAAHVLAQAVQELWPEVKVTIGPVIDNGFFYDFDSPKTFSFEDLEKIEKQMNEILARNEEVIKETWTFEKAVETFSKMGERFKVEIIKDLHAKDPGAEIGIYHQGQWFDLCRGPHVQKIGQIKAIKVLHTAGAYWRGDEKNPQLQRIYATAFLSQKDLDEHLKNLEEAKTRDHRKVGKDLGLFYFHELSPGSPFFTPKGAVIYNQLIDYMREKYKKHGYNEVISPIMYDVDLYHKSGHYENYRENMYFSEIDEKTYSPKPMNCPGHCLLYGADKKSYRDLPWRIADFGRLHRYERSGTMHGLSRVRSFCQDDAHVFCRMEQVSDEIGRFIKFLDEVYKELGMFEYKVFFSTRPPKRMGDDALWDKAENALENALKTYKIPYTLNAGDGAFYGPKLDIMFVDAIKRPWQLGTIQCDFNMPKAFELEFTGEDNKNHAPVMLHRAILGSLERFTAVYLEHTAGKLPLWLSPTQICIMNVTDAQAEYCKSLEEQLKAAGFRVESDLRSEKLGFKIREAQLQKIPYMLTIGDKEKDSNTVSFRLRSGETKNQVSTQDFISHLKNEVTTHQLLSEWK